MSIPSSRESSVTVAVRVRPFTQQEASHLVVNKEDQFFLGDGALTFNDSRQENKENVYKSSTPKRFAPKGLRKIVDVVDDRMLIFDPPENNPLAKISKNVSTNGKRSTRFKEHRFVFDKLFDEGAAQEEVYYNTTRPLLDSVLDGFNGTIFAYGATGCGKTHTISGTMDSPGIIFLTMKELFERIDDLKDTKLVDVSLSYLEIYNETIRDLMQPDNGGKLLTLREDANSRINVSNLTTHKPQSVEDVMDMIIIGNKNRTSSPTEANATSSRSHAVLQINVTQKNRTADVKQDHTFATLSIIDLAGSERAAATKNRGERLHEGANINKSLLALGNCINALCDVRRRNHVPYRDSKLTRLLKFSLGGNCKTVMIVCISPSSQHYDETLNTLKYANRAKEIKTKVSRNQHSLNRHVASYLKLITEQKQEIDELRQREGLIVQQAIERHNNKKDRVQIGVIEFIDTLKQNLNSKKFQHLKLKKSSILCKRKLLLLHRGELQKYLRSIDSIHNPILEFSNAYTAIEDLVDKITNKIQELEILFDEESELDLILSGSANSGIRKLSELEAWSSYDKITLDTTLSLMKDSVDGTIIHNASIAFDKILLSDSFMTNFKCISTNLFQIINQLSILQNDSDKMDTLKGELRLVLHEFYQSFDQSLNEILNIDSKFEKFIAQLQYDITSEISIPTSPIRQIARARTSSPFNKASPISKMTQNGISKITKNTSSPLRPPINKNKAIKKVRWNVPDESLNEADPDSDISMDDLAKDTDKLEMHSSMSLNNDQSILDQSFSELENSLSKPKKRKSLTSKSLQPISNGPRRSLTGNLTNNNSNETNISSGLGPPIRLNNILNDTQSD
ncbi:Kinesin-like protein [Wickerhamomyces ciferrii]|uniref:Kinesin-like protein n=1 Tax=Wickerhamomyces ciferrii (strain ATCC 14091 / BCRC 22168 / CBS 111 / JCM 3599 / NBRC 0793 / NRRL Y-1031 F-60-10) TaxID=1206466 RepID=K0KGC4_WICCF|nr:Kinesin-like protein [Wickerhamomyces ciferrii]CCH44210.1 Kinesin-like protein [Wickerhamomyces ciferrii]